MIQSQDLRVSDDESKSKQNLEQENHNLTKQRIKFKINTNNKYKKFALIKNDYLLKSNKAPDYNPQDYVFYSSFNNRNAVKSQENITGFKTSISSQVEFLPMIKQPLRTENEILKNSTARQLSYRETETSSMFRIDKKKQQRYRQSQIVQDDKTQEILRLDIDREIQQIKVLKPRKFDSQTSQEYNYGVATKQALNSHKKKKSKKLKLEELNALISTNDRSEIESEKQNPFQSKNNLCNDYMLNDYTSISGLSNKKNQKLTQKRIEVNTQVIDVYYPQTMRFQSQLQIKNQRSKRKDESQAKLKSILFDGPTKANLQKFGIDPKKFSGEKFIQSEQVSPARLITVNEQLIHTQYRLRQLREFRKNQGIKIL
ncbi:UNKNOWN [Stylonychia lemnae]|uniref:Uncharacterized protein n=1 Tax=Stylonychia lemnae TaxID=5949 RepID=A0A078B2D9_STYLE|nr:UNKNOWN [Stylonychia lemnae]|eukprot:CDW87382.1 UNKNOWN [Stylonychia lemnae]